MLRARTARREEPLGVRLPDPVVSRQDGDDPEQQALLAEGVGLALLVVLDTLTPAERLAFVLHDMFAVPFDEIGPIVGRSAAAAKTLASRARRRVHGAAVPDADLAGQREVVDGSSPPPAKATSPRWWRCWTPRPWSAWTAPPGGHLSGRGAAACRAGARHPRRGPHGAAGAGERSGGRDHDREGQPFAAVAFTVRQGKIAEIDIVGDPARLSLLDPAVPNS